MKASTHKLLKSGKKSPPPAKLEPMLCTLTRQAVTDPTYIHEVKFDGYRIIAHLKKGKVRLDSRSGLDYTSKYPAVVMALKKLKHDAVFDGEVCALNEEGQPDFDTLQKPAANTKLVYYCFDLVWLDGYNIMELPLIQRKTILKDILGANKIIRYSKHFDDSNELFSQMQQSGMEGIVSKKSDSEYIPGQRGAGWYKTPTEMRQEFVIGGWVESERRQFRTLLFGAYKGKKLQWIGHAGGGFKHSEMSSILKKLKSIEINRSPFSNEVDYDGKAHWVQPKLVANFKFATFTKSGRIRKPAIFLGFRNDKKASDVIPEIVVQQTKDGAKSKKKLPALSGESNWKKIEKQAVKHRETIMMDECELEVTDIDREIWKGVTKMELIQYYHSVSGYLLPHIQDRPQSLHIKPVNALAPGFYIKDMEGRQPECAEIYTDKRKHPKAGKRNTIDYLVCNNESSLLFMINLGCIDVNPWTSRTSNPEKPDYIIIDLDPSDDDFKKAIDAANACKQLLDEKKIRAFIKTSGKTGLHVYLPCSRFGFKEARTIAERICDETNSLLPGETTTAITVSQRGTKLYLDPNQNDYADTVAAPYSARPSRLPMVSTPLEWKEINQRLDATAFTIHSIGKRLSKKGDLFADVLKPAIAEKNNKGLLKYL